MEFYGTIGPACAQPETLQRMVEAGMTGIRMNLSHGPLSAHKDWLDIIHAVGIPQLLIDLQGPELRVGRLTSPVTLPEGGTDYIVPLMLNSAGLPNLLIGVILVLLISASVSTLSSITLTACSTVSMDLIKASWLKGLGEKTLATVTRLLCLAFVVLSYLIANYPTPILEMMSYSWGILSGAFLAPYVLTLYWKGINRAGAWAGMLGAFLTAFVPAAAGLILAGEGIKDLTGIRGQF